MVENLKKNSYFITIQWLFIYNIFFYVLNDLIYFDFIKSLQIINHQHQLHQDRFYFFFCFKI